MSDIQDVAVTPAPYGDADSSLTELEDIVKELISNDDYLRETLQSQAIDKEKLIKEAKGILAQRASDFVSSLEEFKSKEQRVNDVAAQRSITQSVIAFVGGVFGFAVFVGLIVLIVVIIAKWSGHLLRLSFVPFIAWIVSAAVIGGLIASLDEWLTSRKLENSRGLMEVAILRRSLYDQLSSLVIIPAMERAISLNLVDPSADVVSITSAQNLSSLVGPSGRIQTGSYRDVLMHLKRYGGAAVGLAGTRGVGKSELLQTFCGSTEVGGIIGVIIPAPVAYEAEPFLRLLIRRLAEEVPDFGEYAEKRTRILPSTAWNLLIALLGAVCIAVGLALSFGFPSVHRYVIGWLLLAVGGVALMWLVIRFIPTLKSLLQNRIIPDLRRRLGFQSGKADLVVRSTQISKQERERLAVTAVDFARRVRYLETRSINLEGSAAWQNIGIKRTSGVSLGQIPLTEPDLVLELSMLVRNIRRGGYEIRIGIDELDKLVTGEAAEKFLTGIKVLFSIHDCSFILTISEDASAQFARRGMPIRDVFDSSLDAVVVVQPLTFREAKRIIRARLSRGHLEEISDSQALVCYSLAGGLPRDLLRFCRQLGEFNFKIGGNGTLENVLAALLKAEVSSRLDGVRAAIRSRDEGSDASVFIGELEMIENAQGSSRMPEILSKFLKHDPSFNTLTRPTGDIEQVSELNDKTAELDWIPSTRRQLYSYLYFIQTVSEAFGPGWPPVEVDEFHVDEFLAPFELLADARRQVEADAAAGWRRITQARIKFGLALI